MSPTSSRPPELTGMLAHRAQQLRIGLVILRFLVQDWHRRPDLDLPIYTASEPYTTEIVCGMLTQSTRCQTGTVRVNRDGVDGRPDLLLAWHHQLAVRLRDA